MRLNSLDALRGIAAATVLIAHLFISFPQALSAINIFSISAWQDPWTWFRYTPLRTFVGGRPAVVLFFVLSGFVLALTFMPHPRYSFLNYLWRRFCRIYVPAAIAILLSAALALMFAGLHVQNVSDWFMQESWTLPVTPDVIIRHLFMTGASDDFMLNNVLWSLIHELRISLLFPLIMFVVLWNSRIAALLALAFFAMGAVFAAIVSSGTIEASWFDTLKYSSFFMMGALLAKHREVLAGYALDDMWVMPALGVCIVLFAIPAGLVFAEPSFGIASAGLIVLILTNSSVRKFLEVAPLIWLGKVSFSLYLVHLPILLSVFYLWGDALNPWLLVGIVVSTSLVATQVFHMMVEEPAMRLGKMKLRAQRDSV